MAHAARLLRRQYRDSQHYWHAHPDEYPRRPVLLDLHYYHDASLSGDRAETIRETVRESLGAFLRSDLARRIRAAGARNWLPIDRHAAARLEHRDGELLVLVKPDFAFREEDRLTIVDWKTGRPDPFWEGIQVTCYALYAAERWSHPLEKIVPQIVHLYPSFRISDAECNVREARVFIAETQEELEALLAGDETPPIDRFPITEDCTRCRWCPFRGVCEGGARQAA